MSKQDLTNYIKRWEIKTNKTLNNNNLVPLDVKLKKYSMKITLKKGVTGLAVVDKHNIKLDENITQAELEILYDKMPHLIEVEVEIEKKKQEHSQELNTPTTSILIEPQKDENNSSEALPKPILKRRGRPHKTATN